MISPRTVIRNRRIAPLPRPRVGRSQLSAWRRLYPLHALWLVIWAPWWVGNDLPPPSHPRSREGDMTQPPEGTAGAWILDTLDDLRFRFGLVWTTALLLRGAWIGGVVGIIWILVAMLSGAPSPSLTQLAVVVAVGMGLGLLLRMFHRPRYRSLALLLEHTFGLRSRLSTAVLGLRYAATGQGSLHQLQLADAANALSRARTELKPSHWIPVREVFIVFIVTMILLLLLVARRPEGEIPVMASAGVPRFVPVSERLAASEQDQVAPEEIPDAATLEEVEDISRASNQARQDLEAIGDALDGNAVTSPAGSAIDAERYPEANQELTDASEAVSQLPGNEREALADELEEASDRVSEDNPELADSARNAATDVREGEDRGAVDELGDQIENTGESVVSQEATGGDLRETQSDQQSGSQSGEPGGSSSSPGEQPEPGDQGAGQAQAGAEGDPGAGMDASGGVGSSNQEGEPSGGSSGSGEEGGNAVPSSGEDAQGEPADVSGESNSGDGSAGDSASNSGDLTGRPDEEDGAAQGAGAGGSQRDANDPNDGEEAGGGGDLDNEDQAPEAGEGEAGDPPPGGPDDGDERDGATTEGGGSSITLPGTSDERVSSGSDIGSSSVGSGGGVGTAAGDSTSGVSGSSGPDPNDVPSQWRQIVEDYFRDGGAP